MTLIRRKESGEAWETAIDEGGAGLPEGWSQSPSGSVTVEAADPLAGAPLDVRGGLASDYANIIEAVSSDPFVAFAVVSSGAVRIIALVGDSVPLRISNAGGVTPTDDMVQVKIDTEVPFRLDENGTLILKRNAAPADADLAANEVALWFDPTNGAAKLKIKGKSADGTVVQGEVALS